MGYVHNVEPDCWTMPGNMDACKRNNGLCPLFRQVGLLHNGASLDFIGFFMISAFAHRLREERLRLGLSQVDFAKLGQVGRTSQLAYERGETPPTVEYLWNIANGGADPVYLLAGRRFDNSLGVEAQLVIDMMAELSARERAAVMALLMQLTGRVGDLADPLGLGGLPARPLLHSPARDFKPE